MSADWKANLDSLIDQESGAGWRPFPEHYVDTRYHDDAQIPQVELSSPPVHVVCKMTDDFAAMQQFEVDEESLPPKVLCWNDISALDTATARKTVESSFEKEYRAMIQDVSVEFHSVSDNELDAGQGANAGLLVYHVLDPTLTRKARGTTASQPQFVGRSMSQPLRPKHNDVPKILYQVQQLPIQEDMVNLRILRESIKQPTIFIFDCSFAEKAVKELEKAQGSVPFIAFAASKGALLYTPQLPCDLFTSCLLTPAKVALLCQSQSYNDIGSGLLSEIDIQTLIDMLNNSSVAGSMITMLENALSAYVDRMAYDKLKDGDRKLFEPVFGCNPLVARLFANYLFAVRTMKRVSTKPLSRPVIPDLTNHPLWDAFDLQIDQALYSLKESLNPKPKKIFSQAELLDEQFRRLDVWLQFPKTNRPPPDELPFLVLMLGEQEFTARAIRFCSQFLHISRSAVVHFLHTRAFPLLPSLLSDGKLKDSSSIADFSYVILNCCLCESSLKARFEDKVDFWLKNVVTDNVELQTASLGCLLLFLTSPEKIDMYKENKLDVLLKELTASENVNIRTISHLILSKMGVPLDIPMKKIASEKAPIGRAALVARIATTLETLKSDDPSRTELIFDLLVSLNDCCPLVREEALVSLSRVIACESSEFLSSLSSYFDDWRDDQANNPSVTLIGHELQILQFEPSRRVMSRLTDFVNFLTSLLHGSQNTEPLVSNLDNSCLTKIAQSSANNLLPPIVASKELVSQIPLVGAPVISPSGLLACGDSAGKIMCQKMNGGDLTYDYFTCGIEMPDLSPMFSHLLDCRKQGPPSACYMTYIDDTKLMAVSNRSQVIVIDANVPDDTETAFWMTPPDVCSDIIVDYNHKTFQILHSTGTSLAHVFDLETQQKSHDIRLPRRLTRNMQWIKPFSPLFWVAQDDLLIYDIRAKSQVTSFIGGGTRLLGCNVSSASSSYLMTGYEDGLVAMIDFRMMTRVAEHDLKKPLTQFEVHPLLPFCVGTTADSMRSFSFEKWMDSKSASDSDLRLTPEEQTINFPPSGFSLHPTEACCAIRSRYQVQSVVIDY